MTEDQSENRIKVKDKEVDKLRHSTDSCFNQDCSSRKIKPQICARKNMENLCVSVWFVGLICSFEHVMIAWSLLLLQEVWESGTGSLNTRAATLLKEAPNPSGFPCYQDNRNAKSRGDPNILEL
jgi:hypothetical protein